jgi:alpha-galactosidase
MVPGLWLEPEVVGATSQVASELPDDGFFQRSGRRHVEAGRFHLDFRHPATVARLDAVIDRLVAAFGIGYFKFDYNVDGAPGTDVDAISPGDGLFGHNRAFAAWLEQLLDRHPTLVIENCASGGLRMDYALLSRVQLQSTSDQQNPLLYPPIAAAAPMSILPEQAANWAYPQPEMTDAEIAFSMVTGMTGRLYMSGHIDRMSAAQRALVEEAVRVYKSIRCDIGRSDPFWPNGLPGWTDPWVSVGLRPDASHPEAPTYVALWRRHGASPNLDLVLPHLSARSATVETIYPAAHDGWQVGWNEADARLAVLSNGPAPEARLLRLTPTATTLETHR